MPLDLTWESFREGFIAAGVPGVHPIGGHPTARLFVDTGANRIGLWLPINPQSTDIPRSGRMLVVRIVQVGGARSLEITTGVSSIRSQRPRANRQVATTLCQMRSSLYFAA